MPFSAEHLICRHVQTDRRTDRRINPGWAGSVTYLVPPGKPWSMVDGEIIILCIVHILLFWTFALQDLKSLRAEVCV